jgi:hypothetical protein
MAATNFTPISLYYSATASSVPTAGNLVAGELAINTADGKLFYKDSAGVVQTIASKAGALGDVVGPASATDNAVSRFDLTTGKLIQNSLVTISDTGAISAPVDASISGLTVGKGGGAVATNTAIGAGALVSNTTGAQNNAIGYTALQTNSIGSRNIAIGNGALSASTVSDNLAIGYAAATSTTTGQYNTFIGGYEGAGYSAGQGNTTGSNNTALGAGSFGANTTGASNTALGVSALRSNTTASYNTAVGYQAGYANTTGNSLAFFGYQAGLSTTTGIANAAFGAGALKNTTTGSGNSAFGSAYVGASDGPLAKNTTGNANSAFGYQSISQNTTGAYNTAVGYESLYANTTASNNTAVGYQAGYGVTTGAANTFLGYQAGYAQAGNNNTFIGQGAGLGTTGGNNAFIGQGAGYLVTTGNYNSILGNYSGNQGGLDIRTASNYIVLSDGSGNPLITTADNQTVALEGAVPNSGTGITFPATQSASSNANTLDDYEEGTWTPNLTSTTGTLTVVANGTGYYTKVGRVVTIVCRPVITTNGTGASALKLGGLPFTALDTSMIGGAAREDAVLGFVFGISAATGTQLYIAKYDNTYPGGTGYAFPICITYTTS